MSAEKNKTGLLTPTSGSWHMALTYKCGRVHLNHITMTCRYMSLTYTCGRAHGTDIYIGRVHRSHIYTWQGAWH